MLVMSVKARDEARSGCLFLQQPVRTRGGHRAARKSEPRVTQIVLDDMTLTVAGAHAKTSRTRCFVLSCFRRSQDDRQTEALRERTLEPPGGGAQPLRWGRLLG